MQILNNSSSIYDIKALETGQYMITLESDGNFKFQFGLKLQTDFIKPISEISWGIKGLYNYIVNIPVSGILVLRNLEAASSKNNWTTLNILNVRAIWY